MWTKIAGVILRNRTTCITAVLVATLLIGYQVKDLEMSYENASLLPQTDSVFIDYVEFQNTFGQEGNVMVFAVQDPTFFTLSKVNNWIKMENDILDLEGVTALVSVTHSFNLYKNTDLQKFQIVPIFPSYIETQAELDSLSKVVNSLSFYEGTLFNSENNTYGMMVTVAAEVMNSPARVGLVKEIQEITHEFTDKYELKMYYSGLPYIRVINAENIKHEMYMFIALSLLITTCILYFFFRSFRIVGFCILIIIVSVVWAMGFMALLKIKITLLTAMLPPLLIVIGIPNSVFMINKYHAEYVRHGNKIKALQRMVQKVGNASLLSNLTTAAGFATFIITSSQILIDFGIIAFISITSVFVISLILIPAIFSFLPPPDQKQTKHLKNVFINNVIDKIVFIVMNRRNVVYITTIAIIILAAYGITLMKTTGYMVDDLKETDPIRQDLSFFEANFEGLMPLEITVDFLKPNQVFRLSNLEKLDRFGKELKEDPEISNPLSVVEAVKFARQAYYNGNPNYYKIPTATDRNFILRYAMSSGEEGMSSMTSSFVDSTSQKVRMTFRVKDIGTKKMEAKVDTIENILARIFPPSLAETKVTGSSIVFFKGNQYLVKNLFSSLSLAVILIAGFMAWMFKSKRMVFIALVPNIIPQLLTAALMGYLGIPIKASTILVFSIAFGISIDNTIHYLAKYRQELQATNWSIRSSVILALKEAGKSMFYSSIILFFGFGIFCLSDFGGTFALGLLTSITLFTAMLANLILLPSLLLSMEKV
ncbi:MAG: MMPL family transporter [Odoribacter sp.]|nr:MMPL family transporter [Odoribacter sp.]